VEPYTQYESGDAYAFSFKPKNPYLVDKNDDMSLWVR
jgi:hypothetical protein